MAGPWIFSTLLGLMVVVQFCNARAIDKSSETSVEKKEDVNIHLLRRIMFNVRRISQMLAFQILDEEDQRSTLEKKRASLNPKRKCILHNLILGKSSNECSEKIAPSKEIKSTRRSLDSSKRRSKDNVSLNSNSNTNINDNSKNEDDMSVNSDTPVKPPVKQKKRNRWIKTMLKKNRNSKRLRTSEDSLPENKNTNENVNINLNDDHEGGLNDEDDALNTLSDSDDGPGALNDDFNDALNDESGANDALNDESALSDDADGNGGMLRDADDGPGALNDENEGVGALNDEDGSSTLNDEE